MVRTNLGTLYLLNQEIQRIKKLTPKAKKRFQDDLAWCEKRREELISERLLEQLKDLSDGELEVAKNHYYEGMNWTDAYSQSDIGTPKDTDDEVTPITLNSVKRQIQRVSQRTAKEDLKFS